MASWKYLFLFPGPGDRLVPSKAVTNTITLGTEFESKARMAVQIDDAGHLLDIGDEVMFSSPNSLDISHRLDEGDSFSIQARIADLPMSVQFFIGSPNPHICIGWSRRLFKEILIETKEVIWKTLCRFALDCNASYAIVVDDAPDLFEDRFLEIDGKRILDMESHHEYGHRVREVWTRSSMALLPPEGPTYSGPKSNSDGFVKYFVSEDS